MAGTRKILSVREDFVPLFLEAKARVRSMDYKFVRVDDPATSTIFEVYAALALGTEGEFNLVETH